VSETPVREAIQQLATAGIVQLTPSAQAKITSLTKKEVNDVFQLRIELESLASSLAVDNLSNGNISEIEEIHSISYANKNDFKEYFRLNRLFHETIYQYCDNKLLQKYISNLYEHSSRHPRLFINEEYIDNSIKEHSSILDALKNRDKVLVGKLVREHKERARSMVIKEIN
jgi:DNA-binding GntR family transcriptional regulator